MKLMLVWFLCFAFSIAQAQSSGIIVGSVLDEKGNALQGATVELMPLQRNASLTTLSDATGNFQIQKVPFGWYQLRLSYTGLQTLTIDSIHFRLERFDFNMNDLVLKQGATTKMDEIIIYAEKPLIESKDGNITFNAGESALSAGRNASDLLTSVPLISKDPSGEITVRGKQPKILIDDKPVEMSMEQLQDLLESMPGSTIEKIEVMTNPPPQYANEEGGVINIVTKKGTIGMSGRLNVYAGTRGEKGGNGSFNYRQRGFTANLNAGVGSHYYDGSGYAKRQNIYPDSTNQFITNNSYRNKNLRPNLRANVNYDINKNNSLNLELRMNGNRSENHSFAQYQNLDKTGELYRLSERDVFSSGNGSGTSVSFSYTMKTQKAGEKLRFIASTNAYSGDNSRDYVQQFFTQDHVSNGHDSTQQQTTTNGNRNYNLRLNYDLPVNNQTTFISAGGFLNSSRSENASEAVVKDNNDEWNILSALTNQLVFSQQITNLRTSVKQKFKNDFSVTGGLSAEQTRINFELVKAVDAKENDYWTYLPFGSINKTWNDELNLTLTYRRTIRRPGMGQLNPTIDSSDQFNIRSGNPILRPSLSNNFDLVFGKSRDGFYANVSVGYNQVEDVFSQLRTTPTEITWQNISGRKEYEASAWSGYSVSKSVKLNLSANYSYNAYSDFDKTVRQFRNGGSFSSKFNAHYNLQDLYSATGSFTFNRFANPQGTVRSSVSMNIGLQAKMLQKKMAISLNIVDPFAQQQNHTFTYGKNFILENQNTSQSRSFRLSVSYTIRKTQRSKKAVDISALKDSLQTKG